MIPLRDPHWHTLYDSLSTHNYARFHSVVHQTIDLAIGESMICA